LSGEPLRTVVVETARLRPGLRGVNHRINLGMILRERDISALIGKVDVEALLQEHLQGGQQR